MKLVNFKPAGLVNFSPALVVNFKSALTIPRSDVLISFSQTRNLLIVIIILSFVMILLTNIALSSYLTKPIIGLKSLMKKASEGDFEITNAYDGKDEIAELYRSYEKMVTNIKSLLQSVVKEQAYSKSMELRALQSQINPHFLYNTLDSTIRVAESGKTDVVIELIISLSDFYKAVLKSGKEIVTIANEVEHINSYLKIMKMRYHDILNYELKVDSEVLDCQIPKITLQPIVENAIYHGIKNKRGGGNISIDIRGYSTDQIEIVISDNGVGISDELLVNLLRQIEGDSREHIDSFGLINVYDRLKLFFNEKFGFEIISKLGVGTQVRIVLPRKSN